MGFLDKVIKKKQTQKSVLPNQVGPYTPGNYQQSQRNIPQQNQNFQPSNAPAPFQQYNQQNYNNGLQQPVNQQYNPQSQNQQFQNPQQSQQSQITQDIRPQEFLNNNNNQNNSNFSNQSNQNYQNNQGNPNYQYPVNNGNNTIPVNQILQVPQSFNQPMPQDIPQYQRPQYQQQAFTPQNQVAQNQPSNAQNSVMVQNLPSQNQMPQKAYTKQNHMVPVNKLVTTEDSSKNSKNNKPSIAKEILANILPFGLGKKLSGGSGSNNSNSSDSSGDISIVDQGSISVQDFIAPSAIEVDFNEIRVGNKFLRTIFAIDYKFSNPGMLEQIINYEEALDVSMFYYPINSGEIVKKLRQKISEFEASLNLDLERGRVPDAYMKVSLQDAIKQQELLASGIEKWFNFALYITIKADSVKELNNITQALLSILASKEISAKTASLAMEKSLQSTVPVGVDKLFKVRNMDTTSIANTFPFTSSDLSMDKGIMYGINTYNRSLVIFDRFAMPNANMVVFATSGAGKSFMVKLEAIRSLMLGIEVIVIDPENEYMNLARSIGGAFISFSQDGANKVNPFELSGVADSNEDELKLKELSLIGFFKLAFGNLTNTELAVLERGIRQTYFEKGITNNPSTHKLDPPRLEDLYKVFKGAIEPEAQNLSDRLEKFIIGSASGIFDKKTNVDLNNPFTVFSIRDLSDELKPLAMYFMMDFIWNKVKSQPRKRILIIDEAWLLMRYPESALFINSIAKRARKYYLGLTVISQNVEDFLQSDIGVAVVTNSSIQVLLKQHPTAIEKLQKVFYLSDGEKNLLLGAGVGMGLFFADNNHVAIEIKASDQEYKLCSTKPQDVHDKTIVNSNEALNRAVPNSLL